MNEAQSPRAAAPERSSPGSPLLALKGISKSFGAVEALKEVDLELRPGEVVGLVGDNGAGKSTLIKAIAGVQPADDGEALFEGNPVTLTSPQAATRLGIATVYQDLALCENLDVVENLYLGQEVDRPVPGVHLLDEPAMERRTLELLDSLGVTTIGSVRTEVAQLSGGQRQAVAIARSLLGEPKVVLLDEPTAALGIVQTREILNLIERLKERGLGVVVISHNLANVFEVADRIVVLRLGRAVASLDADETRREDVVGAITGAEFGDAGAERTTEEEQL
jgi:D-xylose transport system ATP-binding protein